MSDDIKEVESPKFDILNVPRSYCNNVKINQSSFDFQLIFSELVIDSLSDPLSVLASARFIAQMSPQHAKAMYKVLGTQIAKYEETHGKIKLPKSESK